MPFDQINAFVDKIVTYGYIACLYGPCIVTILLVTVGVIKIRERRT